jgi:hypothetical protein
MTYTQTWHVCGVLGSLLFLGMYGQAKRICHRLTYRRLNCRQVAHCGAIHLDTRFKREACDGRVLLRLLWALAL